LWVTAEKHLIHSLYYILRDVVFEDFSYGNFAGENIHIRCAIMPAINFKCKKCNQIFCYDAGRMTFPHDIYKGKCPNFEREIYCARCGLLTLDDVELTELGQTQLTELFLNKREIIC
jgi:hypothetical protein